MNFHFKQCFDSHSVYLTFFLPQYCETLLSCLAVCQKWQVKQLSLYCNAVPVSTVALRKTYELRGVFALLGASSCHWLAYKLLCHRPSSLEVRSFAQDDHYSREGTSCQNTYKQHFSRHNSVICCWSFPIRKRWMKLHTLQQVYQKLFYEAIYSKL